MPGMGEKTSVREAQREREKEGECINRKGEVKKVQRKPKGMAQCGGEMERRK